MPQGQPTVKTEIRKYCLRNTRKPFASKTSNLVHKLVFVHVKEYHNPIDFAITRGEELSYKWRSDARKYCQLIIFPTL